VDPELRYVFWLPKEARKCSFKNTFSHQILNLGLKKNLFVNVIESHNVRSH
jgi:hypothetical protein